MPGPVAYKVLTEFKFEVGGAIASATGLQGTLDNVSNSAKNLQFQLAKVGMGFAAQFGLVGGGVIGIAGQMIRQFDRIEQQQIKLGGIIFANKGFLSGINNANDALKLSDSLLLKIAQDAEKFGLDESALAQFSSLGIGITSKEGISPEKNIELGRNILKAAPQLGIDAFSAQSQFQRALLGGAGMGDPAFKALAAETTVFKDFAKKVGGITKVSKEFNKLDTVERFNMLNAAFGQFTSNAQLLEKQSRTLSAQFKRIKQGLFGLNGVFKPLGQAFVPKMQDALEELINFINTDLRRILKDVGAILKQIIPKFDIMLVRLQELADVAGNFQKAGIGAVIFQIASALLQFKVLNKITGGALGGGALAAVGKWIKSMGGLREILVRFAAKALPVLKFIGAAFLTFVKPLLAIFAVLALFSRARAFARIEDAKVLPGIMAKFSGAAATLTSLLGILLKPFQMVFDMFAMLLSPLFRTSYFLDIVANGFTILTNALVTFFGFISGLSAILAAPLVKALEGDFRGALNELTFDNISKNFNTGQEDFFRSVLKGAGRDDAGNLLTSGVTQNINKVEVRQEFKEKLEPDRVAFTLVNTLKKIGQNPTQASGRSFATSGVGN